jgi:hypothetical protein
MSGACGSPGEPWEGYPPSTRIMDPILLRQEPRRTCPRKPTAQKTPGKERRPEQFLATRSENAGIGLALLVFN